jgi:hypothetical protein
MAPKARWPVPIPTRVVIELVQGLHVASAEGVVALPDQVLVGMTHVAPPRARCPDTSHHRKANLGLKS